MILKIKIRLKIFHVEIVLYNKNTNANNLYMLTDTELVTMFHVNTVFTTGEINMIR